MEPGAGAAAFIGAFSSSSTGSGGATGSGLNIASVAPTPFCGNETPGLIIGLTGAATGGFGATGGVAGVTGTSVLDAGGVCGADSGLTETGEVGLAVIDGLD